MTDSRQNSLIPKVKLLMLGESRVGKSSILTRFVDDKFTNSLPVTLGVEYRQKTIILPNNQQVNLQIWDTAGQERFRTITPLYYKSVDGVVLVYSIEDQKSFENVDYWLQDLGKNADKSKVSIVLVGNKVDVSNKAVEKSDGEKLAQEIGVRFYEASAKKNTNIKEIFYDLADQILQKRGEYNTIIIQEQESYQNIQLKSHDSEQKKQKDSEACCK